MTSNSRDALSVNLAFDRNMETLFANFTRHLGNGALEDARKEFRKQLANAKQARSEMMAIIGEA